MGESVKLSSLLWVCESVENAQIREGGEKEDVR